ncbi:MAG TPA: hypothetical protein VD867_14395 [Burkholderiales bacterium]|nr:hypothetical protein [Burkholderiales bacterium]
MQSLAPSIFAGSLGPDVLMAHTIQPAPRPRTSRQTGFGGLFLLFFVGALAGSAALFAFYRVDTVVTKAVRDTSDVLGSTKAALVAYAVQRGRAECDPSITGVTSCTAQLAERPGELPCPDTNNDGVAEATCRTTNNESHIGRVPWKTLGIAEPKDAAGETLWYAVSSEFRNRASNGSNHTLNSDSRGSIVVLAADPECWPDPLKCPQLASDAVAIIFSPGMSQGTQNRGDSLLGLVSCTVVGLTIGRDRCPSNYLETVAINASTRVVATAYVPTRPIPGVNDQLAYLTTAEIIPPVELRVAGEVKKLLESYRAKSPCECYPWAEDWPYLGGIADLGQNRGRLPSQASPHDWGTNGIPAMPQWLDSNDWHNLVWYSVGKKNTDTAGRICRTCSSLEMLRVETQGSPVVTSEVSVVFIMPGTAGATPRLPRPPGSTKTSQTDVPSRYMDDEPNRVAATCPVVGDPGGAVCTSPSTCYTMIPGDPSCDTFVIPQSQARDRDRLYTLTSAPPHACLAPARVLIDNGPCRLTGNAVNSLCLAAAAAIADPASGCSAKCKTAAAAMITTPCRNNYSASGCTGHINTLKSCNS